VSAVSKSVLVVTRPPTLPAEVAERVNRDFVVRLAETPESLTSDGLVELSDGASGLLVTPFDRIDASFFERVAPSVKIVATRSVGYDHIDVAAGARRNIAVANTPGVLTASSARRLSGRRSLSGRRKQVSRFPILERGMGRPEGPTG
jgi:lactate dehydrogenase-like 2-hydroxyacid dehydrogenase